MQRATVGACARMVGTARSRLTLVAMTLAGSMILVDQTSVPLAIPRVIGGLDAPVPLSQWVLTANVLPLAAFMVLGGRLGDLFGLRRVFLTGAVIFAVSSALAGGAQDFVWLIVARVAQGTGAALMLPTSIAIVSNVFEPSERGRALGLLAGFSAFFAALGPVLGGLLTAIDWRAVFFVNVPIAVAVVAITLRATPQLRASAGGQRSIDWPGVVTFALGTGGLVLGLAQGSDGGWSAPGTVIPLAVGALGLVTFAAIELRARVPLMNFGLLRHLNFAAANVSQTLAGAVELGLGFLLPLYLLLIIGLDPATAGLALIPASIPIMIVGPLAGRAFDRVGGRAPMVAGFLILAASAFYLAWALSEREYILLVPGLVLQGIGLGVVLTVNDPTGLGAVPDKDRGEGAGIINTTEQLGGALGIAALSAILHSRYVAKLNDLLDARGIELTEQEGEDFRDFILSAEQTGLGQAEIPAAARRILDDAGVSYAQAFEVTLVVAGVIALVGAFAALALVRHSDRLATGRVFARRSRWVEATAGRSPAITRRTEPDPVDPG